MENRNGVSGLMQSGVIISERNNRGTVLKIQNGASDLSSLNLMIKKYNFEVTGNDSWMFFDQKDYQGKSFTLRPTEDARRITEQLEKDSFISVQSITRSVKPLSNTYDRQWIASAAWFLGPKAENLDIFNRLATKSFTEHGNFRRNYFPTDRPYIKEGILTDPAYINEIGQLEDELDIICRDLKNSIPMASLRMQGHMHWDTAMPANLGYLAALLYNTNNVTAESSPMTTAMEIEVGQQLCEMLGYNTESTPQPWSHITSGGTTSNIEAMWTTRNVKFYPLGVQKAVKENDDLMAVRFHEVFIPGKNRKVKLEDCTTWDLLNMDIDDIIKMSPDIQLRYNISEEKYANLIDKYTLTKLGFCNFFERHGLETQGVICIAASNHYSWFKGASLLGLGSDCLQLIPCDEYLRMDMTALRQTLTKMYEKKIPVLSVVAILGSTEASAVDNLDEVVQMRKEFAKKGLNFAINVDGAWGGYFASMLRQVSMAKERQEGSGYVPFIPLSDYTRRQFEALKYADTVTVDPHKSGFIPYPAGALCYRNGSMKSFVTVTATYIHHNLTDPTVGVYGILGSKPGAVAVAVLLAHRVIGLDEYGYGAILGQCMFGAKLLYCKWLTLAKEDDNFVCILHQPLPPELGMDLESAKQFIHQHITGRSNEEIMEDPKALSFLRMIGPDLVINAFTVNPKIDGMKNPDIDICEKINHDIFLRLSSTNMKENVHRIPLIITASSLSCTSFQRTVESLQASIGLKGDLLKHKNGLPFVSNCVMNPWISNIDQVETISEAFRQTVLDSIGTVLDSPSKHTFITAGVIGEDNTVFAEFKAAFNIPHQQYQAVIKLRLCDSQNTIDIFRRYQKLERTKPPSRRQPIVIQTTNLSTLGTLLSEEAMKVDLYYVDCFMGIPTADSQPFLKQVKVRLVDIPRFKHLDMTRETYPDNLTYFLYGDQYGVHLSHTFTKCPDFMQVVDLLETPNGIDSLFIELGVDVIICDTPHNYENLQDPLTKTSYMIKYTSFNGEMGSARIKVDQENGKVWFDSKDINCKPEYVRQLDTHL